MTPIPRGLLIAGGLGLAAGAGFLLFKNMKKEDKPVDPAADPAAAGAGGMTPTAGTPGAAGPLTPGATPTGTTTPGLPGAGTGAGTGAGSGMLAGGQQVGPYTVIPDPQSGQMMVFETATEQPVGILDAQGNLVPLEGTGGALGPGAGTGSIPSGTGTGTVVPEGAGLTPTGTSSSGPSAAAGQEQFAAIAKDLFANAGNSSVGSASSDAMAGQTNLAPATGLDAGATSSSMPTGVGAPTGLSSGTGIDAGSGTAGVSNAYAGVGTSTAGMGTGTAGVSTATAGVGAAAPTVKREKFGEYTVVDDGSGTKLVLDASETPVAMMDASNKVTPIKVDAQGNVTVTGPPLSSAQVAAAVGGGGAGGIAKGIGGMFGL